MLPTVTAVPRRRIRALRLAVVPSAHTLVQWACGAAALYGTYLKLGLGITLLVGGVAGAVLSMLREGGKI